MKDYTNLDYSILHYNFKRFFRSKYTFRIGKDLVTVKKEPYDIWKEFVESEECYFSVHEYNLFRFILYIYENAKVEYVWVYDQKTLESLYKYFNINEYNFNEKAVEYIRDGNKYIIIIPGDTPAEDIERKTQEIVQGITNNDIPVITTGRIYYKHKIKIRPELQFKLSILENITKVLNLYLVFKLIETGYPYVYPYLNYFK